MAVKSVIAFGELLIDFTQIEDGTYKMFAGGAPANVSVILSLLEESAVLVSRVGNDSFGKFLINQIEQLGVISDYIQVDETHNTTLAFVHLSETGDRSFDFYRNFGADVQLKVSDKDVKKIKETDNFYFGSVSLTSKQSRQEIAKAINIAQSSGALMFCDVNLRENMWDSIESARMIIDEYIQGINILKFSKDEMQRLYPNLTTEAVSMKLLKAGTQIVIVTDGKNQTQVFMDEGMANCNVPIVDVFDTTGAGDAFFGIFIFGITRLTNRSLKSVSQLIEVASKHASETTAYYGAIDSYTKLDYKRIQKDIKDIS